MHQQQQKTNQPKVILVAIVEQMILISKRKSKYILEFANEQTSKQKSYAAFHTIPPNLLLLVLHISQKTV